MISTSTSRRRFLRNILVNLCWASSLHYLIITTNCYYVNNAKLQQIYKNSSRRNTFVPELMDSVIVKTRNLHGLQVLCCCNLFFTKFQRSNQTKIYFANKNVCSCGFWIKFCIHPSEKNQQTAVMDHPPDVHASRHHLIFCRHRFQT